MFWPHHITMSSIHFRAYRSSCHSLSTVRNVSVFNSLLFNILHILVTLGERKTNMENGIGWKQKEAEKCGENFLKDKI